MFYTTTADSSQELINLSLNGTNRLQDHSEVINSYKEMYRFWRLKSFKVSVRSGATFTVPDGAVCLGYVPDSESAPTHYEEIESMNVIPVDLIPGSDQTRNVLTVPRSKLVQNQSWKITHNTSDAEDLNTYGTVLLLTGAASEDFVTNQHLLILFEFDLEFKQLYDSEALLSNVKGIVEEEMKQKLIQNKLAELNNIEEASKGDNLYYKLKNRK